MGDAASHTDPPSSALVGPASVVVSIVSPHGPFARAADRLAPKTTSIEIANHGQGDAVFISARLDPMHVSETGERASCDLAARVDPELASGCCATVEITCAAPARPGSYATTLRLNSKDGAALAVPVEYRVIAHAAWGFALVLLGLLCVGLLAALDAEGGVKGTLRAISFARQNLEESFGEARTPESLEPQLEAARKAYDSAMTILRKPRKFSFFDRRIADAGEYVDEAERRVAVLRKDIGEKPAGALEVADLESQWKRLDDDLSTLSRRFATQRPTGVSFADRLAAFDAWAAGRLLSPAIERVRSELSLHVVETRLTLGAGRDEEAALQARAVRRWMRRATRGVETVADSLAFFARQSVNDVVTEARLRRRIADDVLSSGRRAEMQKALDALPEVLGEPFTWEERRLLAARLAGLETKMLEAARDATLSAVKTVREQSARAVSTSRIEEVIAEGQTLKGPDGKIPPDRKAAYIARFVTAWRARLASAPNRDPPALVAEVDAIETANRSGDVEAVRAGSKRLFDGWGAYGAAYMTATSLRATAPFCVRLRDDIEARLVAAEQELRRAGSASKLRRWEAEHDLLRMKLGMFPHKADGMPTDCLAKLLELDTRVRTTRDEILADMWSRVTLTEEIKHDLAENPAFGPAFDSLRSSTEGARKLTIAIEPPKEERVASRRLDFSIGNLDPQWGPGVGVVVDFGDGSKPAVTDAEALRAARISHTYEDPGAFPFVVKATEAGGAQRVGEGGERIVVAEAPAPLARRIADELLDLRLMLALALASVLYFWRYYAQKAVFGASAFDYAQAFALGFAVSLAMSNLPQQIAQLLPSK